MKISLESLTARVTAKVQADRKAEVLKKLAKTGKTQAIRDESAAEAAAIQASIDWRAVGLVFRMERWDCACGASGHTPQGLFIHYEHTRMANTWRLAAPRSESTIPSDLPKRRQITSVVLAMCGECSFTHGFMAEWVPPKTQRLPSLAEIKKGDFTKEWEQLTAPEGEDDGE